MLNDEELAAINAIFHKYPCRVAQIASWILNQTPNYCNENYGFKTNITALYEKEEKPGENNLRGLPWALLSNKEDVRHVCEFVARHLEDGTFVRSYSPRKWRSLIDGKIHVEVDPIDKPFQDYKKIKKYPYIPVVAFREVDDYLSKDEVTKVNEVFHAYPSNVANIAKFILEKSPLDEDTDYGFEADIESLFKKEVVKEGIKELHWQDLSNPTDVKRVCDFVLSHINDGTFKVKSDSLAHKDEKAFDAPFEDLTEIARYSYDVTGGST